jgi:hypothetical protein
MSTISFGFQRDTDKKIFRINDSTVWTEPLLRSDYDLYMFTSFFDKTKYIPVENTPNLPLPAVNLWTVTAEVDGSYIAVMAAVKPWEVIPYAKDSLVSDLGKVYKALVQVPPGTALDDEDFWLLVESHKDLPLLSGVPNGHIHIGYFLHDAHALVCIGEKSIAYASETCKCTDEFEAIKDWAWTNIFYSAAVYSHGFGEYEESGKYMANVNSRCGNESGNSPCNC